MTEHQDTIATGICKGPETYVVIYRPDQSGQALRQFGRWASNPELSFTWWDAARMSKAVRELTGPPKVKRRF